MASYNDWKSGLIAALTEIKNTYPAGKILYGSGSPLGAVSATPGTRYIDTNRTLGARVWHKDMGTDTTGWVCVEGDTGWIDATAYAGVAGTNAGTIMWRRLPTEVQWKFASATIPTGTGSHSIFGTPASSLPTHLRPASYVAGELFRSNSMTLVQRIAVNGPSLMWLAEIASTTGVGTTTRPPTAITGIMSYPLDTPWHTTIAF